MNTVTIGGRKVAQLSKEQLKAINTWTTLTPEQQRFAIIHLGSGFKTTVKLLLSFLPPKKRGAPLVHARVDYFDLKSGTLCGIKPPNNKMFYTSYHCEAISCRKCLVKYVSKP